MSTLSLDLFIGAAYDLEHAQYRVLAGLQQVRNAFARNQVYPHLSQLIRLHGALKVVMERSENFKEALPGQIKKIDLEKGQVQYEWPELDRDELAQVKELIAWTLPQLTAAIEEGRTIFEFVDENLRLEEVGLVPSYVQEGYLLVPDREAGALHILQYSLSIFTGAEEKYRSLRTTHLKSIACAGITPSPRAVKLDLMAERRELPNPATYFFDTDLAFPFEPTVFPVAKRKLMRHLFNRGAAA